MNTIRNIFENINGNPKVGDVLQCTKTGRLEWVNIDTTRKMIKLYTANESVGIKPNKNTASYEIILPTQQGKKGTILVNDGNGNLVWTSLDSAYENHKLSQMQNKDNEITTSDVKDVIAILSKKLQQLEASVSQHQTTTSSLSTRIFTVESRVRDLNDNVSKIPVISPKQSFDSNKNDPKNTDKILQPSSQAVVPPIQTSHTFSQPSQPQTNSQLQPLLQPQQQPQPQPQFTPSKDTSLLTFDIFYDFVTNPSQNQQIYNNNQYDTGFNNHTNPQQNLQHLPNTNNQQNYPQQTNSVFTDDINTRNNNSQQTYNQSNPQSNPQFNPQQPGQNPKQLGQNSQVNQQFNPQSNPQSNPQFNPQSNPQFNPQSNPQSNPQFNQQSITTFNSQQNQQIPSFNSQQNNTFNHTQQNGQTNNQFNHTQASPFISNNNPQTQINSQNNLSNKVNQAKNEVSANQNINYPFLPSNNTQNIPPQNNFTQNNFTGTNSHPNVNLPN